MTRRRPAALAAAVALTCGTAIAIALSPASAATGGTPLPAHVFAPYFEAWTGGSPTTLAQQSGARYLTMAFLQAATKGSCVAYWNGDTGSPISSTTFGADFQTIRAGGGDVIPSFGGFTADDTGTEIADSCTNVASIAAVFENVITTYNVTRIDLDVEDNSLTNTAGIDRRNQAIKQVDDWAAGQGRTIQFSYTLPTTVNGLADSGLAVLRSAVRNSARVDVVNIMTFDYYDNGSHEMATDTQTAATGLRNQLATLYPGKTDTQLWNMIGVTEMIGIDDFGAPETFTTADAPTVESWAASKGLASLSFWALQRDNGGCPGTAGSDSCSGVSQSTWQFSHAFEPFTSGGPVTPPPTTSPPTTSPPTTPPPTGCTAPAWVSTTAYVGGSVVSEGGHKYTSKWWTQGEDPATHHGQFDVWTDNGTCTGGGTTAPPTTQPPTTQPPTTQPPTTQPPTTQPPSGAQPWVAGHAYHVGDLVTYGGHTYRCIQAHTSQVGWEPPNVPALWQLVS